MVYVSLKHDISLVYVIVFVAYDEFDVHVLICYMLHVDIVVYVVVCIWHFWLVDRLFVLCHDIILFVYNDDDDDDDDDDDYDDYDDDDDGDDDDDDDDLEFRVMQMLIFLWQYYR